MNTLLNFINIFRKRKWWIIILVVLSIIISFIFTSINVKPKLWEVSLKFFPTRLPGAFRIAENIYTFQYLTSIEVENAVLEKYGNKVKPNTNLSSSNYKSRITIQEDQNIVDISVKYEDSITAYEIADYIVYLYSQKTKQLKVDYHKESAVFFDEAKKIMQKQIDSIQNVIENFSKTTGLLVSTEQTKEVMSGLLGTSNNAHINKNELQKINNSLLNHGAELQVLENTLTDYLSIYRNFNYEYVISLNEQTNMNLYANIISGPIYVQDTSISKFLVILLSALITFAVTIFVFFLIDTYSPFLKEIRKDIEKQ